MDHLRSISFTYSYFLKVEMDLVNLCQSISIHSDSSAQEPAHGARATECTIAERKKKPTKTKNKKETRSEMVVNLENFNVYKGPIFSFIN